MKNRQEGEGRAPALYDPFPRGRVGDGRLIGRSIQGAYKKTLHKHLDKNWHVLCFQVFAVKKRHRRKRNLESPFEESLFMKKIVALTAALSFLTATAAFATEVPAAGAKAPEKTMEHKAPEHKVMKRKVEHKKMMRKAPEHKKVVRKAPEHKRVEKKPAA